jgi:hypothetical protein
MAQLETILYDQFEITARPIPLASGKWTTDVRIRRNAVVKLFTAANEFDSEDEAIIHSLSFGRQIIDEKFPSLLASTCFRSTDPPAASTTRYNLAFIVCAFTSLIAAHGRLGRVAYWPQHSLHLGQHPEKKKETPAERRGLLGNGDSPRVLKSLSEVAPDDG